MIVREDSLKLENIINIHNKGTSPHQLQVFLFINECRKGTQIHFDYSLFMNEFESGCT